MPSRYKCGKYTTLYLDNIVSMLEDPERYGEILRWTRDGRAFQVLDRVRLVAEALPSKGGKVCKYVSFKKQMNNYGFASRDDEFFHIHFNRANPKGAKLAYRVCREDGATKAALAAANAPEPLAPSVAAPLAPVAAPFVAAPFVAAPFVAAPFVAAPLAPVAAPSVAAPAPEFAFYHHLNTRCLCLLATGSDCSCEFDWSEPLVPI